MLLDQWTEQEGPGASTRKLRNLLLEAELFNEDVAAVLSRTAVARITLFQSLWLQREHPFDRF